MPFCTPFGNTLGEILKQMVKNSNLLLGKMKNKGVQFTYRIPNFEYPGYGDMDAFWWSNPVDIRRWFVLSG